MKRLRKPVNRLQRAARRRAPTTSNTNGHITPFNEGPFSIAEETLPRRNIIPASQIDALEDSWRKDNRWRGITRNYNPEQVLRLRGTLKIEHTIADKMARK